MNLANAWLVNGREVPLPVQDFNPLVLIPQGYRVTESIGGCEIVHAFDVNDNHVPEAIMDMSELLQSDPCLLIQKLVNAKNIATFYDRDNTACARVNRAMYEDLHNEPKQIGNQSLFIYQISRSSVLNALIEYAAEVSEYTDEKRTITDCLDEEEPLPNDVPSDRQEQIQYARKLWKDTEELCQRVWLDEEWTTLVNEMNQQGHPIFTFFSKPSFAFDEDEEADYFPVHVDYDGVGIEAQNAINRENIEQKLKSLAKRVLIGHHWFKIGDTFYAVLLNIPDGGTVIIKTKNKVESILQKSMANDLKGKNLGWRVC